MPGDTAKGNSRHRAGCARSIIGSWSMTGRVKAREIAREVGEALSGWRKEAAIAGLAPGQIDRMASAFEHDDLRTALDL